VTSDPLGSHPTPSALRPGAFFVVEGRGFATGRPNRIVVEFRPGKARSLRVGDGPERLLEELEPSGEGRCSRAGGVGPLEHLAAGLGIAGWEGWTVRADHADLPLLEGSAEPWFRGACSCGIGEGPPERDLPLPGGRWSASDSRGRIEVRSAPRFRLEVCWSHGPRGVERWSGDRDDLPGIVPARTFIDVDVFLQARAVGLLGGVDERSGRLLARPDRLTEEGRELAHALGVEPERTEWTGGAERMAHECAAHKALDLVGDILLWLGYLPRLDVLAIDAGHVLHHRLGKALRSFSGSAMTESPCP
jgi:hypothetical protein